MLALLADGLGTGEIAGRLYISESTAKTHITHIYQKLGAANRAQALVDGHAAWACSTTSPPNGSDAPPIGSAPRRCVRRVHRAR